MAIHKIIFFYAALIILILVWGYIIVSTHSSNSIVSWDEGFHGGSALFISQSLRENFDFVKYNFILNEFKNGLIWYLPLWAATAGILGAVFGPSLEIYRFTTLIFGALSILLVGFFTKEIAGVKAALIAAVTLATTPLFIVYSHLMMIEVPQLFSTSLALLFFYRFLTKKYNKNSDLLLTLIFFAIGVLTKITAIIVIISVVSSIGVVLFLFFKNNLARNRFYNKWTLIFISSSLIFFTGYRYLTKTYLGADMVIFYLNQFRGMSNGEGNLLLNLVKTIFQNSTFYLNDLLNTSTLFVVWFGSLLCYFFLKRSILSVYLISYVLVTYLIFSAVKPQAPQYFLPIFTPLAIATGLFWGELINHRKNRTVQNTLFVFIVFAILSLGYFNYNKTQTFFWRSLITNQQDAVNYIVKNLNNGDRIISSGDGTRFLIRLASRDNIQILNGAAPLCEQAIQDSTDWAFVDYGPHNPVRLKNINPPNWELKKTFRNEIEESYLYKNLKNNRLFIIEGENILENKCSRYFPFGQNRIIIYATPILKNNKETDKKLSLSLRINPFKPLVEMSIGQAELKSQYAKEQKYTLNFSQEKVNQPLYFAFIIPQNIELKINKIVVETIE